MEYGSMHGSYLNKHEQKHDNSLLFCWRIKGTQMETVIIIPTYTVLLEKY